MMKTCVFAALAALPIAAAFADVPVTKEEAATVRTYDLQMFARSRVRFSTGALVKLKFSFRGDSVSKKPDGSLIGRIEDWRGDLSDSAQVIVPTEGVNWFMALPAKYTARKTVVVFVRVEFIGNYPAVELLGREIKTDIEGSRIVW